jgi:hypothetical protein
MPKKAKQECQKKKKSLHDFDGSYAYRLGR